MAEEETQLQQMARERGWPTGVEPLGMFGVDHLGKDKENRLYWDGQRLQTVQKVRLRTFELILAVLAAVGTFGMFALEIWDRLGAG